MWELEWIDGLKVGLFAGLYSGNSLPLLNFTPQALQSVLGAIGPILHIGVSSLSQCLHLFKLPCCLCLGLLFCCLFLRFHFCSLLKNTDQLLKSVILFFLLRGPTTTLETIILWVEPSSPSKESISLFSCISLSSCTELILLKLIIYIKQDKTQQEY